MTEKKETERKAVGNIEKGGAHYSKRDDSEKNGKERNEKETGDEFTGFVAAGLFGLANLSVIFNILSRYATRLLGSREAFKNAVLAFNRFQQKHLRRYHYLLNIAAIAIASWHWYLSESASISFQQLGMVLAVFLGFSGIHHQIPACPQVASSGNTQIPCKYSCDLGNVIFSSGRPCTY